MTKQHRIIPGMRIRVFIGSRNREQCGTVIGYNIDTLPTDTLPPILVVQFDNGHTDNVVLPESCQIIPITADDAYLTTDGRES